MVHSYGSYVTLPLSALFFSPEPIITSEEQNLYQPVTRCGDKLGLGHSLNGNNFFKYGPLS